MTDRAALADDARVMLVLPMVVREMQEAARQRGTFWVRLLTAIFALGVTLVVLWMTRGDHSESQGQAVFIALASIAWVLAISSGLWLTADSISAEKREGTLGLLFLTDLRSHDILLGKLTAHVLRGLGCLLALIPLMCLPLLMGGRTLQEVWRVALAIWAAFFFSVSVGLAVSACCVRGRANFVLTALVLGLVNILMPWVGGMLFDKWRDTWVGEWAEKGLICASPACGFFYGFEFFRYAHRYGWSMGVVHALAVVALAVTWWRLPRKWLNAPGSFRQGGWREWWHRFRTGSQRWRQTFRGKALESNPCYWLAARDRWEPWVVWFPLVIAVVWWGYGLWDEGWFWIHEDTIFTTALGLGGFYKLWFAWRAALFLGEARRDQTLELWLTAPIQVDQVIWGQWQALWRMFGKPLAAMVGVFGAMGAAWLWYKYSDREYHWAWIAAKELHDMQLPLLYFYGVVSLFDLAALGWMSMWLSYRLAHPHRAALTAMGLVMGLPWLVWTVLMIGIASVRFDVGFLSQEVLGVEVIEILMVVSYLVINIGLDLVWISYGRWRLRRFFRLVAATPPGVRPPFWEG